MKFSAKSPLAFARESGSLADFVIVNIDYDMGCPKIWKRGRGNGGYGPYRKRQSGDGILRGLSISGSWDGFRSHIRI